MSINGENPLLGRSRDPGRETLITLRLYLPSALFEFRLNHLLGSTENERLLSRSKERTSEHHEHPPFKMTFLLVLIVPAVDEKPFSGRRKAIQVPN